MVGLFIREDLFCLGVFVDFSTVQIFIFVLSNDGMAWIYYSLTDSAAVTLFFTGQGLDAGLSWTVSSHAVNLGSILFLQRDESQMLIQAH